MLLALMKKELLALSRDLHGLGALFVLPMIFIIVMSMALKDVYSSGNKELAYAILNHDHGGFSELLSKEWEKRSKGPHLSLPDNWQSELQSGRLKYVLEIDAGLSQRIDRPRSDKTAQVHLLVEPGMDSASFENQRAQLTALLSRLKAERALERLPVKLDLPKISTEDLIQAERFSVGARPTAVQQNVPAWLIFGMFFVVASIAGLFVEERACGALARLRTLGVSSWQMLLSKTAPYLLVNGLQAALMLSVGIWLMPLIGGEGLSLTGIHWPALVGVLAATSFAAVSLALIIATLVGTHAQASTLGPILNVLMAAFGGIMVPTYVMPKVMQDIAAYSPMNWALTGLQDVLLRQAALPEVVSAIEKLSIFGVFMLLLALYLFNKRA